MAVYGHRQHEVGREGEQFEEAAVDLEVSWCCCCVCSAKVSSRGSGIRKESESGFTTELGIDGARNDIWTGNFDATDDKASEIPVVVPKDAPSQLARMSLLIRTIFLTESWRGC